MTFFLRVVLRCLGLMFAIAGRCSARFRAQVTSRRVIELCTDDGLAYHFVCANRRVCLRGGPAPDADLQLRGANAGNLLAILLSPRGVARVTQGMLDESISLRGDAFLLLWFWGLAQMCVRIARPPRLPAIPPDGYVAATSSESVSQRTTRLPVADTLDPDWPAAHQAHQCILMVRGSAGETIPPF